MKTLRKKQDLSLIKEAIEIRERRLKDEKREKAIKEHFKTSLEEGVYRGGDAILILEQLERSSIDKKKLEKDKGLEFIKKYTKITNYIKLDIKKAA